MYTVTVACPQCKWQNLFFLINPQAAPQFQCVTCQATVMTVAPIQGFLYVLSNERMPGLVKVGFTTRTVEERVSELNSATGVPAPFVIEAYFVSNTPASNEAEAHARLGRFRLENKEFFNCSVEEAIQVVKKVLERAPLFQKTMASAKPVWRVGRWGR